MPILFVSGVNDRSVVGVTLDKSQKPGYLIDGNCSIFGRLPLRKDVAAELLLFGKGVQQQQPVFAVTPSLVVNQISDADTHRGTLERCSDLCAKLRAPVINHPEKVQRTTRERVSLELQGIDGVIVPRTVRCQPLSPEHLIEFATSEHIRFPLISRIAGEHGGKRMVLLRGADDRGSLHVFPFDGRDFYLTEFVEFADEKGLYHKQRIVVIDGEPFIRHSLYDASWKVNSASVPYMRDRESWEDTLARMHRLEEESLPMLRPAIQEITRRLELEYFGIDCCILPSGELLVFEANANMNVLYNPYPEMNDRLGRIHARIYAMLAAHSGEHIA